MIHPTAIVDSEAELAEEVDLGPHVVIEGSVRIGRGTRVFPNAYLCGHTTIGEECEIHPCAVVGHTPQDLAYTGERSYCVIGNRTVIREYASVHRGTAPESTTTIGDDCMLMAAAHVGHNCRVGNRVKVANGALVAGHVEIGDDAFISAMLGIHQFVRVGHLVMLTGMSRVSMDVPPYFICGGDSTCVGVNSVGMRRAGLSRAETDDVKQAFRTLYRSGLPFRRAVERLGETAATDAGRSIFEFVRQPSKRGYAAGVRRRTSTLIDGNRPDDQNST